MRHGLPGDEAALGAEVTAQEVADSLNHLRVLWQRAAAFFSDFDLLLGPVDVGVADEVAVEAVGLALE